MVEVREYVDASGRNFFDRWINSLPEPAQGRIYLTLDRLELGNLSILKGVGHGIFEVRIDFGPGYRVYCGREGNTFVLLLGGGQKKRQQEDIEDAHKRWQDYKRR